jgi:hypothetical protein
MSIASINPYKSYSLTSAVNKLKPEPKFLLNKLFKKTPEKHASSEFLYEIKSGDLGVAQFVTPHGKAKPIISNGTVTPMTVTIPRTFETYPYTAKMVASYEALLNNLILDAAQRAKDADGFLLEKVENLKNRVYRLREWMAAQAISVGAINYSDSIGCSFAINFGFVTDTIANGGHIITVESADKWDTTTADIPAQLELYTRTVYQRSTQNPDTLILTPAAATAFLGNAAVKDTLDTNNYALGKVDINSPMKDGARWLGRIMGLDVYLYAGRYTNTSGITADMITDGKAIVACSNSDNNRVHLGPVERLKENGGVDIAIVDLYVQVVRNPDNTGAEWKVESNALVGIHNPDEFIVSTVV